MKQKSAIKNKNANKTLLYIWIILGCAFVIMVLITVYSQFHNLIIRDYLEQTLDTFFNAYTIFYSLMFSTTFLINIKDIRDIDRKHLTQKWIRIAQIIMFIFFFIFILSYLNMKSAGLNTLNLILAIVLMFAAAITVFWSLVKIVDYANKSGDAEKE